MGLVVVVVISRMEEEDGELGVKVPVVEPLSDEGAFVDCGAAVGGGGEDDFGVGEGGGEGLRGDCGERWGLGEGGWGGEGGGEEDGAEFGGVGAAAVEEDEGLFVGEMEWVDDEGGGLGLGFGVWGLVIVVVLLL